MNRPLPATDLGRFVGHQAALGRLVVQPRMGMAAPSEMAAGVRAVAHSGPGAVATITLDSYTRVGDHEGARQALAQGQQLNGFPLVVHGPEVAAEVAAAAAGAPVQVRHGSARPGDIFATMAAAGLSASEGGPVSYCLPYGRTPLAESVAAWRDASAELAEACRARGLRAHLETFGGCLLGQLCPPSLLVAMSVLEALFFAEQGVESVSLSYAQQTHPVQDVEALAALRLLSDELLPSWVDRHLVLYTYMGVFPHTEAGARRLLDASAEIAVRGGAERMIVKTVAEAHRIPTVAENIAALRAADARAQWARRHSELPWRHQVDPGAVLTEARALIDAVLQAGADLGAGLSAAFRQGLLDVPFCLHADNRGLTQAAIDDDGRLRWADTGRLPFRQDRKASGRIRSQELLGMLRYTADHHDAPALDRARESAEPAALGRPHRIAVIGAGPRGLAVLERIAARLAAGQGAAPVELFAIDALRPGTGRIWRTDQPQWLLMNTPAGEVTMFSGPRDDGADRAGAGPSLGQWWAEQEPGVGGDYAYAPRATYGRYLAHVLDTVESSLPPGARLHRIEGRVERMRRPRSGAGWTLELADGSELTVDRAVLATGHPQPALGADQQVLADFAAAHGHLRYVHGDSAADMPLDALAPGARVGVLGLGLAFYDVMSLLTEGRGGVYVEDGDGLRYRPSGREPRLVAGSRSGVPLPARGRNQKAADHTYQARIFTRERVDRLRARGKLDFDRQIRPWLLAEVNLVYYATEIRGRLGTRICRLFVEQAVSAAVVDAAPDLAVAQQAMRFGCHAVAPVDLDRWAKPFAGRSFTTRSEFTDALREEILADLDHARLGNADGPVKAALDTLRDVRSTIRAAVDLSGLGARSHELDFLGRFVPVSSHLSAGPPLGRLQQVLALMDAGVLDVVGPDTRFGTDREAGTFTVRSPQVDGGRPIPVDAVVDARIPVPDQRAETSPLLRDLQAQGIATSYANVDDDAVFDTGGLAVTDAPFHLVDAHGQAVPDLHAIGIPTEHTRWFTQVGSGRPGAWGGFTADADAVAAALLVPAATARPSHQEARA